MKKNNHKSLANNSSLQNINAQSLSAKQLTKIKGGTEDIGIQDVVDI